MSLTPSSSRSRSRSHSPFPPEHPLELTNQVGGHAGVQMSEDGSLIFKPALPKEHQFYTTVLQGQDIEGEGDDEKYGIGALRRWVPRFYGTLKLEGVQNEEGQTVEVTEKEKKETLVLENLTHRFSKPNILDIKLGTVLYDDDATEEKKARMTREAQRTTSLETGVRLTGFQVYDNSTSEPVRTGKAYGKSIKASELPDGIARFFPVLGSPLARATASSMTLSIDPPPHPPTTRDQGLPASLLLPVLQALLEDVQAIREILASIEMRMVAGSFLFIYESDVEKVKEGLKWMEEHPGGLDEEALEDEDDEEEEDEDEDEENKPGPPYIVKLIDFAHTKLTPGQGPDAGVLKGVDTTVELLRGRIEEVKKLIKQ